MTVPLGNTAVRREIPSSFKELWEVNLLNITGSFAFPFLKVLLTFSLQNLISVYAAEDGTVT